MLIPSAESDANSETLLPLAQTIATKLRNWFFNSWELYIILAIAIIFRVYAADKVPFDEDQAGMLRLARDACLHGLWPASSNVSSTTILHGPISIYFLLLTSCFTENPLGGTLTTALWNVIGILITYLFMRRYYGRFPAAIATGLFAVTTGTVIYNRFIWQPSLIPPLTILLMFTLFWGAVERRQGWFAPAIALLGVMYQIHESSIYMVLPFAVALLLSTPGTIRKRDLALAGLALGLIFLPYLVWLRSSHFVDIYTLLAVSSSMPGINLHIYKDYIALLSPYIQSPSNLIDKLPDHPQSLLNGPGWSLSPVRYLLRLVHNTTPLLVISGGLLLLLNLLRPGGSRWMGPGWRRLLSWLHTGYMNPMKRGILLLLVWQGVLMLLLTRHTLFLYTHYTLFLLPGPFILAALGLDELLAYLHRHWHWWNRLAELTIRVFIVLTFCAYIIGSLTFIVDTQRGAFNADSSYPLYIYYTQYDAVKHATELAEQVADQQHIKQIYLLGNSGFRETLRYIAQGMRISPIVIDAETRQGGTCVALPDPRKGPGLLLVAPHTPLTDELIQHYTKAKFVAQIERAGGDPFKLYIVEARTPAASSGQGFANTLQLLDAQARRISPFKDWLVTQWSVTDAHEPSWRTNYQYTFEAGFNKTSQATGCTLTAVQAGMQLLVAFKLPQSAASPSSIEIKAKQLIFQSKPLHLGPLSFEVIKEQLASVRQLQTTAGKESISLPVF
ncbi:glycosyltransferase family 39 protein [Ktedonosporobacter rubrisoli]|uniref:Glycosyltransferase family 39 protein n=1 Tax=Ktedonosporobacter rubrisoli TaxID=2509675 RepID=A0A4P6K1W0_KTERU|nr:glycosyltransferase family 39 protein [Ktedonosporobacter rubrisoli]QBD82099.1 glycosyltransferase family 39 protein [Ktedonosporobacter rubrisoli]